MALSVVRSREEWLASLAPGTPVAIDYGFGRYNLDIVAGFTPSGQIKLKASKSRFRPDGWSVGSDARGSRTWIVAPTDEIQAKVYGDFLGQVDWRKVPLDRLKEIFLLLSQS